ASNSTPYLENASTGVIADVLQCGRELEVAEFAHTTGAGMAAWKAAADAVASGRKKRVLVIASDSRPGGAGSEMEMSFGAAAIALIIGEGDPLVEVEGSHTYNTGFMDRWRSPQDAHVRDYDTRFSREYGFVRHVTAAAKGITEKIGRKAGEYDYVVLQQPDDRITKEAARGIGITPEQMQAGNLYPKVGDAGAASALLGLASVLDKAKAGQKVLLVSYGSGAAEGLSLVVKRPSPGTAPTIEAYLASAEYLDYAHLVRQNGLLERAGEVAESVLPVSSPLNWRINREMRGIIGKKCSECGYVDFPLSAHKICVRCGHTEYEEVALARKGIIHTYSLNYYMPQPFESPLPVIVAELEDGNRYAALGTEMKADGIKVDMPVELVLRRMVVERGISEYGHKFRPIRVQA
ncbi:MAG: 3-oxoacyl-[acyl-carrier-protein] synthase III C-terminal domain-containing protein, partial [Dehalococcoidia bacterium]|nr:3-oxoacyl-[acyl-carrier-protein] synthase III C-terminal domain-containing protein [Dehalococcoidia bacterium]